jgi:predicted dehydrogenase
MEISHGKNIKLKENVKMKKINIGVIGCGARSRVVVNNILNYAGNNACVSAIYDPSSEAIESAHKSWSGQDFEVCTCEHDVINHHKVNFVMIFTPNAYHKKNIISAIQAGKKVFSEKPLAINLEDCIEILKVQEESNATVMTGFVLRYSPVYRKVKELLSSGTFGKIININATENRIAHGGGNSMSSSEGWRRKTALSGPYLLEKCSHDLDLLNWFAEALPLRVAGFGGLDLFIPENTGLLDKYGYETYGKMVPVEKRINPFYSEKDIKDNHSLAMEYPNGIKMTFQLTLANAIPERRMYISCTEGTISLELFSGSLKYKRYSDEFVTELGFPGGDHGGGDSIMARELVDTLLSEKDCSMVSGVKNGLDCAIVALAADKAMNEGIIVNISEMLKELNKAGSLGVFMGSSLSCLG